VAAKRSAATTPPAGEPVPEIRQASSDQALPAPSKGSRRTTAVVAGVLAVAVGAAAYALWPRAAPAPATPANTGLVGELSEALVQSRLELATASFNARNYRSAITAAGEVLRAAPNHAAATKIRDEAQAMLTRLDESVADARRLVAAGNAEGAARALDAARAIDPNAAGIAEVAAQLVDHYKGQANAAREGEQRARAAQQRPPAAPAPAPRPPAQVTPASPSPSPPNQPAPLNQAPATQAAPPSPAPAVEPPPAPPPPPPKMVTPPVTPEPVRRPDPAPATPAPAPPERREPPPAPSAADDESAIRRVIGTYARAIETKDLGLFRSVKPNMSREEQQRISDGFRAVSSQQVDITILSIERRGDTAMVRLRRRDTVEASGRRQTTESQQTMTLTRAGDGWVIGEIGR
jgi:ketosteroid isomerase-like protein